MITRPTGNGLSTTAGDVDLPFRPPVVILTYWREVTWIEEDAVIFPIEYIEIDPQNMEAAA